MADITTYFLHEDDIDSLGVKYQFLRQLESSNPSFSDASYVETHSLGYEKAKSLNIIFIGQTGYGKSTLINKLIRKDIFETSDYESCTKTLQSADYFLHHKMKHEKVAYHLSFIDLPGIGENDQADKVYLKWYQAHIKKATVIVYLFRADKRDHTQDEFFFKNVFDKNKSKQLICVVSQADKIEPMNRELNLSNNQKKNLLKKESEIKNQEFLSFHKPDIIHISTYLDINISELENKIIRVLRKTTMHEDVFDSCPYCGSCHDGCPVCDGEGQVNVSEIFDEHDDKAIELTKLVDLAVEERSNSILQFFMSYLEKEHSSTMASIALAMYVFCSDESVDQAIKYLAAPVQKGHPLALKLMQDLRFMKSLGL